MNAPSQAKPDDVAELSKATGSAAALRYCMSKGHHRPADGVPVTRAYPSTKWGNRAADWKKVGRAEAVRVFRHWLFDTEQGRARLAEARLELRGRPLGCYCPPGEPCHGDVLVEAVNTP